MDQLLRSGSRRHRASRSRDDDGIVVENAENLPRIIIIGAGAAGLSLAIWLRRFNFQPLVFEQTRRLGGVLRTLGNKIPDYPGIPAISGASLANRMVRHARMMKAEIHRTITVDAVCPDLSFVETSCGPFFYDELVIATGSSPRRLNVPGEETAARGKGMPAIEIRAGDLAGKSVVMVGGGDRAFEEALILADAGVHVTLIHRTRTYRAQRHFVAGALSHPLITVTEPGEVIQILGGEQVTGVTIRHNDSIRTLSCCAVFVRIGVIGNTDFLSDGIPQDKEGFIITDESCRTVPDTGICHMERLHPILQCCFQFAGAPPNYSKSNWPNLASGVLTLTGRSSSLR